MAEQVDEEERAWAVRLARAFLAPSQASGGRRPATEEGSAGSRAVLVVAVVPIAVPVPADDEPEEGP